MTGTQLRQWLWRAAALAALAAAAACADTLPDQDLRIYQTAPSAKLSADILWEEYQAEPQAADNRYWGRVVEITGEITSVSPEGSPPALLFGQDDALGVQARLLDDEAGAILHAVGPGDRVTLRCFCEGLTEHVVLKSCIRP
jgi:hypothetical protein